MTHLKNSKKATWEKLKWEAAIAILRFFNFLKEGFVAFICLGNIGIAAFCMATSTPIILELREGDLKEATFLLGVTTSLAAGSIMLWKYMGPKTLYHTIISLLLYIVFLIVGTLLAARYLL